MTSRPSDTMQDPSTRFASDCGLKWRNDKIVKRFWPSCMTCLATVLAGLTQTGGAFAAPPLKNQAAHHDSARPHVSTAETRLRHKVKRHLRKARQATISDAAVNAKSLTIAVPSMMEPEAFTVPAAGPFRFIEAQLTPRDIEHASSSSSSGWFQIFISTSLDVAAACRAQNVQIVAPDRKLTTVNPSPCALEAGQSRDLLLWDRTRLGVKPYGWQDFWNIAQHPGKRALPYSARITLEVALLADGVPPRDIYNTLRSQEGADRAFRKLEQIRPYLTWWRTARQAARILQGGGALMAILPARAAVALDADKDTSRYAYSTQFDLGEIYSAAVLRRGGGAEKNTAVWTLRYMPVRVRIPDRLHLKEKPTLMINDLFWSQRGSALQQRFLDWVSAR